MSLLDAKQYDEKAERRHSMRIVAAIVAVIVVAGIAWSQRDFRERRAADKFFSALQRGAYEDAYQIWTADPDWKQHPERHAQYTYGAFYNDWGPPGEYGKVNSFKVDCASRAPRGGNGVIVIVTVNERKEPAKLFVSKNDRTLSEWPWEAECRF